MRLARRYSADPEAPLLDEVVKGVRDDLVAAVSPGPGAPLQAAYSGMPQSFGGRYPAMVVRTSGGRLGATGRSVTNNPTVQARFFPDELVYYVDFWAIAQIERGDLAVARKVGEDAALSAYGHFLDGLAKSGLRESARDIYVATFEASVMDPSRTRLLADERGVGLLRLQVELHVVL